MSTTPVALSTLIDDTLRLLYREDERPLQVTIGSNPLNNSTTDGGFTVSDASEISVSDILEVGSELLLVTSKSADATPLIQVARGYLGSPIAGHGTGAVVLKAPQWSRFKTQKALEQFITGPLNTLLPAVATTTATVVLNQQWVEVPSSALRVLRLGWFPTLTGLPGGSKMDFEYIDGWAFEQDLPPAVISTGKLVTIPCGLAPGTSVYVTYQTRYLWSTSGTTLPAAETDTVGLQVGSEDLPSLWAAAYLFGGREITRMELDRVEEWNRDEPLRTGSNYRMVTLRWQEFYRRADEARRLLELPRHRPFRKMRKVR